MLILRVRAFWGTLGSPGRARLPCQVPTATLSQWGGCGLPSQNLCLFGCCPGQLKQKQDQLRTFCPWGHLSPIPMGLPLLNTPRKPPKTFLAALQAKALTHELTPSYLSLKATWPCGYPAKEVQHPEQPHHCHSVTLGRLFPLPACLCPPCPIISPAPHLSVCVWYLPTAPPQPSGAPGAPQPANPPLFPPSLSHPRFQDDSRYHEDIFGVTLRTYEVTNRLRSESIAFIEESKKDTDE